MAKMFTSDFRPKSTTKKAKQIIRSEIRGYYSPSMKGGGQSALDNMKRDADAYDGGFLSRYPKSDYTKGAELVQAGCFACYYDDQRVMLGEIYGKENVAEWSGNKVHNTYKHLIGREYAAMLRERDEKKRKRRDSGNIKF